MRRKAGAGGVAETAVAAFGAAELRRGGCFERRCGELLVLLWSIVGLWRLVCIRSASRADSVQAVLRPAVLRSTDDSKADICDGTARFAGRKFRTAQCLQGFAAETWRDPAHGRQQNWAFGGTAEAGDWRRAEMAGSGAAGARGALSWRNRGSFTELARWAAICPGGMAGDFGESWWAARRRRVVGKGEAVEEHPATILRHQRIEAGRSATP